MILARKMMAVGGKVKAGLNKGDTFKEAKVAMSGDINKEKMKKVTTPVGPTASAHADTHSFDLAASEVKKNATIPMAKKSFLGGKDDASKMMTSHAHMAAGYTQSQNQKMPAGQQSVKMPSPEQHAQRADMYSDFMPKGGAFGKAELEKEMAKMDAHFKKKGKKK